MFEHGGEASVEGAGFDGEGAGGCGEDFAAAKPYEVVSVERQKAAVYQFFNLSLPGSGKGLGEMS